MGVSLNSRLYSDGMVCRIAPIRLQLKEIFTPAKLTNLSLKRSTYGILIKNQIDDRKKLYAYKIA
jgi:hypothetical protein